MTAEFGGIVLAREGGADGGRMSITEAVAFCSGECARHPTQRPRCASPVLMAWISTWAGRLDDDERQQLRAYVLPLAVSRGTDDEEIVRLWSVIDWLIRTLGPLWLREAGLARQADVLAGLSAVGRSENLGGAYSAIRDANDAARRAAELTWLAIAQDALPTTVHCAEPYSAVPVADPARDASAEARRLEAWAAVVDVTISVLERAETLVDCVLAAASYGSGPGWVMPDGLQAATRLVTHAAAGIAWNAIRTMSTEHSLCWDMAPDAAALAAAAAVRAALRPVEERVRDSAHEFFGRAL